MCTYFDGLLQGNLTELWGEGQELCQTDSGGRLLRGHPGPVSQATCATNEASLGAGVRIKDGRGVKDGGDGALWVELRPEPGLLFLPLNPLKLLLNLGG